MKGKLFNSMLAVMTILSLTFGALGTVPAQAAGSPPPYYPYGPQTNVNESDLDGWELCWSSTYDSTVSLNTILTACDGDYLLLGGKPTGSSVITALAAGPREDVLFDTGADSNGVTHNANGVGWYYSNAWSWGFAKEGDPVAKNSCDTNSSPNGDLRLCWHTIQTPGSVGPGYRAGNFFSFGSDFERFIYQSTPDQTVSFSPSTWDFGNQVTGTTSSANTFTLTNISAEDLNLGEATASAGFNLGNDLCSGQTIIPSGTCTFDVTFSPSSVGLIQGTLSIPSDGITPLHVLSVRGTGINTPPTIDILSPITTNGSDLFSTIDILDADNDPLSGVVDILSSGPAPDSVTFETLSTTCGSPDTLNLTLNGGAVGSNAVPNNCTCEEGVTTNVFNGEAISANYLPASDNTWAVTGGSNSYSAWTKATVHFTDGTTQTACLFDKTGTGCSTTYLCTGYNYGSISGSSVQPPLVTVVASQAYSGSVLPAFLDTSGLDSDSYTLRASANDGFNSSVLDMEPFTLAGENYLYIGDTEDTTAPTVDSFSATSPSSSLNIAITDFTASDDTGVTGYLITEAPKPPAEYNPGWSDKVPATYTVLAEDDYTLYPWAKDEAGNVSAVFGEGVSVTVKLPDTTPPDAPVVNEPSGTTKASIPTISGVAEADSWINVWYWDGSDFLLACENVPANGKGDWWCDSSIAFPDGTIELAVNATDAANNQSADTSYFFDVDTTAPDVTINSHPSDPASSPDADFTFSSSDLSATFECGLDGDFVACSSPVNYPGLSEGPHAFSVIATDAVGNASPAATYSWSIDLSAPGVSIDTYPFALSNSANADFTFSSTDDTATFECELDGSGYASCSSPVIYSDLTEGSHEFSVRAIDLAGNTSTNSYNWMVDTVGATVVSVVLADASPTASSMVNFTVTFSEVVTGVDVSAPYDDFSLFTTGVSGASITAVGGSDTTYTVTVNTGTGNSGTIRLDVVDNNSIQDASNNPLDGQFNSGEVYTITEGVDVTIEQQLVGTYSVQSNPPLVTNSPNTMNGPVRVTSTRGGNIFVSERVISGSSFNEVMGYPTNQLTTEYWFPWYDNIDMATWVLVGNASSTQAAAVDIYIGGAKKGSYTIPVGGQVRPRFPLKTGPVRVVSTNGVKIFTSERTMYGSNSAFNEVMGYPANQFTTEYWFPWYDNKSMATWILVGNPSTTSTATVNIYVGGALKGTYSIPKGGQVTPRFNIDPAGPVRVVSTNGVPIFTSERTIAGDSFNEVMGSPANQFTTEYLYPWYDNVGMSTWVLVGNPTGSTAAVDIYIGGIKQASYTIGAGKQINQRFPLNTGPVRVVSTNGVKIFSSERVLYGTSFNEVMGYAGNQLTTEYWFPWYDSISMSTDILVGKP